MPSTGSSPAGLPPVPQRSDGRADGRRTLRFTDVTAPGGIASRGYGMGAAAGDYDNDGYLDLFVTGFGADHALSQQRQRHVHRRDDPGRRGDPLWTTSAAFVDYDRDGELDLFVANYLDFTVAGNKQCTDSVGARDYCPPHAYRRPRPSVSQRRRRPFADVTERAGIAKADGPALGVSAATSTATAGSTSTSPTTRAEPAVDQPARRHVRRRRPALRGRP